MDVFGSVVRRIVMLTLFGAWIALVLSSAQTSARQQTPSGPASSVAPQALVDKYCVTCHNQRLQTAGVMLDKMDLADVGRGAEVWERVLRKVRTGEMPPAGMPRPDQATFSAFASWLASCRCKSAARLRCATDCG